jgi:hypothetical protein
MALDASELQEQGYERRIERAAMRLTMGVGERVPVANGWEAGVEDVEGMLEMLLCEEERKIERRRRRKRRSKVQVRQGKALLLLGPVGTSAVEGALWCGRASG